MDKITIKLSKGFNVEGVKGIIRSLVGHQTIMFENDGGLLYATGLVSTHTDLFGVPFLREMFEIGYTVAPTSRMIKPLKYVLARRDVPNLLEVVSVLLEAGDGPITRDMFYSRLWNSITLDEVKGLIARGATWDKTDVLYNVKTPEIARYFIEQGAEVSVGLLFYRSSLAEFYVKECGLDINQPGESGVTVLQYLVYHQQYIHIPVLLSLGADPNLALGDRPSAREIYGALEWDCKYGHTPFMEKGADGQSWRFEYIPGRDGWLCAQSLSEIGLLEEHVQYRQAGDTLFISLGNTIIEHQV